MIGIDTNILLRQLPDDSLEPDDAPDQARLVAKLLLEAGQRFFVNHMVIAETIWVLRNRIGQSKAAIRDVIERLLASFNVEVDRRATVVAALASYAEHPGDLADHLIGRINRDEGCATTLTFDKAATRSPEFMQLRN